MKSISIPLYSIRHRQIGGTEFATYNMIKGLIEAGQGVSLTCGKFSDLSPEFQAWVRTKSNVELRKAGGLPGPKSVRFLEESLFDVRRGVGEDVLYPNYFIPPTILNRKGRTSVILHDIQYKTLPDYHSSARRSWLDAYLPWMFRHADRVILISESERRLVEKYFGSDAAEKCRVVWNTIDWSRFDSTGMIDVAKEITQHPYILTVCHQFPHKNIKTLLEAFSIISQKDKSIRLYLVGSISSSNQDFISQHIDSEIASRVSLLGFVSDGELGIYYKNAKVFALPSLYEGFGMPAVEAIGLGVPTVVSGTTALPEVTLGRATYVDEPTSPEEWALKLENALTESRVGDVKGLADFRSHFSPATGGRAMLNALQ